MQLSVQDESRYILATVQRMNDGIREIRRRGAMLNDIYLATRSLPPELLANIFLDACSDVLSFKDIGIQFPVIQVISRVCSQWRRVVCATPSLWAHVSLKFVDSDWATVSSFRLLQLHYFYAGELPLHIILDVSTCSGCHPRLHLGHYLFTSKNIPTKYTSYTNIFQCILAENPEKLGSLTLTPNAEFPFKWLEIIKAYTANVTSGFPNLTKLEVYSHAPEWDSRVRDDECELFQGSAVPFLRKAVITNKHFRIHLPSTNLTSLSLFHFPINKCMDLLAKCPNLTEFRQRCPIAPPTASHSLVPVANPKVLPNLQALTWGFGIKSWDATLMTHFKFPHLSSLHAEHMLGKQSRSYTDGMRHLAASDFIARYWVPFLSSLHQLRSFGHDMVDSAESLQTILGVVNHAPTFEHLQLYGMRRRGIKEILSHFRLQNGVGILPQLRSLNLGHDISQGLVGADSRENVDLFLEILESRVNAVAPTTRLEVLKLHVYTRCGVKIVVEEEWTEEQRERLQTLVGDGLYIETTDEPVLK